MRCTAAPLAGTVLIRTQCVHLHLMLRAGGRGIRPAPYRLPPQQRARRVWVHCTSVLACAVRCCASGLPPVCSGRVACAAQDDRVGNRGKYGETRVLLLQMRGNLTRPSRSVASRWLQAELRAQSVDHVMFVQPADFRPSCQALPIPVKRDGKHHRHSGQNAPH